MRFNLRNVIRSVLVCSFLIVAGYSYGQQGVKQEITKENFLKQIEALPQATQQFAAENFSKLSPEQRKALVRIAKGMDKAQPLPYNNMAEKKEWLKKNFPKIAATLEQ